MASSSAKPLSHEIAAAAKYPKSCTVLSLKDYLRDDLSSCSSSGFMSFPRRQCCLQVQPPLEAVFNAFKFGSCKSKKRGVAVPSRSFHPKLLNRSFWKRAFKGTLGNSVNGKRLSDSVFTCSLEGSVNTCSVTNAATVESRGKQDWTNEKEQFSPVSVLDCPIFDDDDEDMTSPFNSPSCSTLQVTKHMHIHKSRISLKPLDFDQNVSWSEVQEEDEPIHSHATKPCPVLLSITCTQNGNSDMFHDNVEENALDDLLTHVKNSIPSVSLRSEVENLLFDFFKESIWENYSIKHHICKVAEDWIHGQPQQQYQYSSLQTRKEMDKCGSFTTFDQEMEKFVMEIELEFSTTLVNEIVVDLNTCYF